jgi:hypothetical protein
VPLWSMRHAHLPPRSGRGRQGSRARLPGRRRSRPTARLRIRRAQRK